MHSVSDRKNLVAAIDELARYDSLDGPIIWSLSELRRRREDVRWRILYVEVRDSTPGCIKATAWVELSTSGIRRQNLGEASGVDGGEAALRAVLEALNPLLQVELGTKVVVEDPEEPTKHPAYSI